MEEDYGDEFNLEAEDLEMQRVIMAQFKQYSTPLLKRDSLLEED